MAERLTEHKTTKGITRIVIKPYSIMSEEAQLVADKLCAFEDILEKYGIESVEELEELLDDNKYAQNVVVKQLVELKNAKTDRNTWKRACELACRHIAEVEWLSCPETDDISASENEIATLTKQALNYFYQQAQQVISKLPASEKGKG